MSLLSRLDWFSVAETRVVDRDAGDGIQWFGSWEEAGRLDRGAAWGAALAHVLGAEKQ